MQYEILGLGGKQLSLDILNSRGDALVEAINHTLRTGAATEVHSYKDGLLYTIRRDNTTVVSVMKQGETEAAA